MMKRIFGLIIFGAFSLGVYGQSTEEIIENARVAVNESFYHVDVHYTYEFLLESGEMEKTNVKSYYRQFEDGYVHSLSDVFYQVKVDSLMLSIDYEEEEISMDYSPYQMELSALAGLDLVDNEYYSITSEKKGDVFQIHFSPKGEYSPFSSMMVHYAKDYFIKKIEVEYSDVEIGGISKVTMNYLNKKDLVSRSIKDKLEHYVILQENGFDIIDKELVEFNKIDNLWK